MRGRGELRDQVEINLVLPVLIGEREPPLGALEPPALLPRLPKERIIIVDAQQRAGGCS
jgi:hypothetical protein